MSFIWPRMLFGLILVPILLVGYLLILRRRRAAAARYANLALIRTAVARTRSFRRHVPPLLLLLAIVVLGVAAARPVTEVILPSMSGTVVLALDISGSMRGTDITPSRLEASRIAARAFVESQPRNVKIGIVVFGGGAILAQPPSLERQEVLASIGRFQTQRGTNIGAGLLVSIGAIFPDRELDFDVPQLAPGQAFGRGRSMQNIVEPPQEDTRLHNAVPPGSYESAVIVLLTDGQATEGPNPISAAQIAADLGVRVYTVGLGTEEGAVIGFSNRSFRVGLDEATLQTIADRTHGQYFRADSDTDLREIYEALSGQLELVKDETEISALFAALGAAFVAAGTLLSLLWYGRIT